MIARSKQSKRHSGLDVLRALAILLVLGFHYTATVMPETINADRAPVATLSFGYIGVELFFLLSGYFIANSVHSSLNAGEFLARRLARIYPAYLVASLLIFTFVVVAGDPTGREVGLVDLLGTLAFSNDLGPEFVDPVFWSLLVEVKFYVIFAFFVALFKDRAPLIFALFALTVYPAWFLLHAFGSKFTSIMLRKVLAGALIAPFLTFFAVGVLARAVMTNTGLPLKVLLVLCTIAATHRVWSHSIELAVERPLEVPLITALVFSGCLILFFFVLRGGKLPDFGLSAIGRWSYSIYLLHFVFGISALSYLNNVMPIEASIFFVIVGAIIFGALLSRLVEWRFRSVAEALLLRVLGGLGLVRLSFVLRPPA